MKPKTTRFYTYIKPILKNRAVKDYAPLVFSLLTSAFFIYFAIRPTITTIVTLQKTLDEQKATLEQVKQKTESLTLARKNYQSLSSEITANLRDLIPNTQNPTFIIDNVTYLSLQNQATISGIQFQPMVLQPPPQKLTQLGEVSEIEFTVVYRGAYSNLIAILDKLNTANRLLTITSVAFNQPEEGPLTMSINAKAYYFKY